MPSRRGSHGGGGESQAESRGEAGEGEGTILNGVASPANGARAGTLRDGLNTLSRRSAQARERVNGWSETVLRYTRENPGRSVGLALGAGYVLGGGLFSGLTARLLGAAVRIGLRVAVVPLVADSIAALGEGLLGPEMAGATAGEGGEIEHH